MIRFILFLILITFSITATKFKFGSTGFENFKLDGVRVVQTSANYQYLELPKNHSQPSILFLDFENKRAGQLRDRNGNYKILKSYYSVLKPNTLLGKRHASFSAKNSYIAIQVSKNQFLHREKISEKFYISFFIIPGELEKNSKIITKTYITRGKQYGLTANLVNNRIQVEFHNLFRNNRTSKTFILASPDVLSSKDWTNIVITVDPDQGKIALFENGVRKDIAIARVSETDPTILPFGFHRNDTSPLFIGKRFYGKMDNFFIGTGEPKLDYLESPYQKVEYNANQHTVEHRYGQAISPVLKTKYSNSLASSINYRVHAPKGTYYEILYRFSQKPFLADSTYPEWKHVRSFQSISERLQEGKDLKMARFQYFQWKVLLRSDYRGVYSPRLSHFSLKYSHSLPPEAPTGLRLDQEQEEQIYKQNPQICLAWNSNHEKSVNENGGGYIIKYGVKPNHMVASLYINQSGQRITGLKDPKDLNRFYKQLGLCIDNELIHKNALLHPEKNLLTLKRGITYYFKVSAYNEFYNYRKPFRYVDQIGKSSRSISVTLPNYPSARD